MGGERARDVVGQDIAQEGVYIAQLLDGDQVQEANERLRRASFSMNPEDFHKLVTVIDDTEQAQTGADLVLDSPDMNRHNLTPGNLYDGGYNQFQNQSQLRHGRNGRHNDNATLVSVLAQDRSGRNWQANVAIMRSSVDPLQATPYRESASNLRPSIHSGDMARDTGVRLAQTLDAGYPEDVIEHLRQQSFGANSPEFMQQVVVADGIEQKNVGADIFLTRISDNGDNYFNHRDRRNGGQFQNQSRYQQDRFGGRSYPISETVVSIIQPASFDQSGGATAFLRSDVALMRSSVQPLDAVLTGKD